MKKLVTLLLFSSILVARGQTFHSRTDGFVAPKTNIIFDTMADFTDTNQIGLIWQQLSGSTGRIKLAGILAGRENTIDGARNGSLGIFINLNDPDITQVAHFDSESIAFYEVPVVIGANSPADPTAVLDINSTTGGVIIPRVTEAQRFAIAAVPPDGMMVYQTDNAVGIYAGIGGAWTLLSTGGGGGSVVNVSSGNITNLWTVAISNPSTTPAFTFTRVDPGAHRIVIFDNTVDNYVQAVIGSGLSYDSGTSTLSASGGAGNAPTNTVVSLTIPSTANAAVVFDATGTNATGAAGVTIDPALNASTVTITRQLADTFGPNIILQKRGTTGDSNSVATISDTIGSLNFSAWDGSSYSIGGIIRGVPTETWDGSGRGTELQFYTTPQNSTVAQAVFRVTDDGPVRLFNTTSPGISSSGELAFDTDLLGASRGAFVSNDGTSNVVVIAYAASNPPITGDVPVFDSILGVWKMVNSSTFGTGGTNGLAAWMERGSGDDFAYSLGTDVFEKIEFGTSGPSFTLTNAGKYQVSIVLAAYDAATFNATFFITNVTDNLYVAGPQSTFTTSPTNRFWSPVFNFQLDITNSTTFDIYGSTANTTYQNAGVSATNTTVSVIYLGDPSGAGGITSLTGDVTATGPGAAAATIANGAVTGAKVASETLTGGNIQNGSIDSLDLASGLTLPDPTTTGTLGSEYIFPQFMMRNPNRAGSFTNNATFSVPITYNQFAITNQGNLNIAIPTNMPNSIVVISSVSTSDIDPATITISNTAPREERADNVLLDSMTIAPATRGYWTIILVVDNGVIERWSASGDTFAPIIQANSVIFSPSGNLSSTNVQTALVELDNEKLGTNDVSTVGRTGLYSDLIGEPPSSELLSVYASGTAYTLTTTNRLADFGTIDPSIPVTVTGFYRVHASANLKYNGATFAAPATVTLSIRNPNGNQVANSTRTLTTITTVTNISTFASVTLPLVGYNAGSVTNSLQLWAFIDTLPSVGTVDMVEASISIERIESFSVVDATAPIVTSASISTNGTALSIVLDESVNIGSGGNGGFVITPSGGASSLTYASGAGSSTLVYTLGRTIVTNETATLAYTQPGNGVEDASGNDLASFSGTNVVNNSWDTGFTPFTIGTDGSDYMTLSLAPTGIADGPDFTVSMWVDFTDGAGDGVNQDLVWFQSSNFVIRRTTTNTFYIRGETAGGTMILEAATSVAKVAADGWFHFFMTVDLSAAGGTNRHIYFDGVEDSSVTWGTFTNGSIDLATSLNRIGAGSSGTQSMRASMCEFYMSGRYLNDPTKFRSGSNKPISLGSNGQTPDGTSPGYYFSLSGGGSSWVNDSSGNGNNFTLTGSFSTPSPP